MEENRAVRCSHLYKKYPMYHGDSERLKALVNPRYHPEEFMALCDISLSFHKGEIIGIIGLNGSGKSTLASIITGITVPTSGEVEVKGEVNMLSANAGMQEHLTGIENIQFKCLLLGFSRKKIAEVQHSIIEFADIGRHIGQPLRTYSSGMRSRLGFAISVHMDPDILIIDEALSVGDGSFAEKCLIKMEEFRRRGKTILFVSHSVMQMQDFCDQVMWLNRGRIVGIEKPENILLPYCGFTREFNAMTNEEREALSPELKSYQEKYL